MYLLELYYCRKVFDFVDRAVCNNSVRLYDGQSGTIDNIQQNPQNKTASEQQMDDERYGNVNRVPASRVWER